MKGSFDSHPRNFGELLGQYEKRPLNVPQFQRGYSWEKSHVAAFWDDLRAFHDLKSEGNAPKKYFLGPIVIMPESEQQILLDGQQRLATATILFSVIRDIARLEISTDKAKDLARDIQRDLISKDDDGDKFALTLGDLDKMFFQKAIQGDPPANVIPKLRSHKAIENAKLYLRGVLIKVIEGKKADEQVKLLKAFKETVSTDLVMVAISVDSEDDAYRIFETLNDRGLRLSVPDLLLNFLMRKSKNKAERTQVREKWSAMVEKMGRRDVDRFLRHMWLSKYGDLKARGLFHEIRNHLETNKTKSVEFAEVCFDECSAYLSIVEPDPKSLQKSFRHVAGLVKYLQIQPAVPLLLAGLRILGNSAFERLSRDAAALAVRHAAVANLNPSDLEAAFYEGARLLRAAKESNQSDNKALFEVRARLAKINPDDETVMKAFIALHVSKSQAQYLIGTIAANLQSQTKEIAIEDGTLEHIFPEKPSAGWNLPNPLEDYLWHIGNLTLLGKKLNEKTANAVFDEKAKKYSTSEIELTRRIPKLFSNWALPDVLKRAELLSEMAVATWKLT